MTTQDPSTSTLLAIYDLGVMPTSFDLAFFLLAAQGEALESGCSGVRLILVDGNHHGVRFEGEEYEALYPPAMRNWKVSHILQALPRLCPMVERTVSIVPREELDLYLGRYPKVLCCDDYNGIYMHAWRRIDRYRETLGFRATPAAHHHMQSWLAGERPSPDSPLVCLTLRESRWSTDRNSDLVMWTDMVTRLRRDGYWPVVVPDTEMASAKRGPEWDAATFCGPAALDLELRMALYEQAQLNLFTDTGPSLLAFGSQNCRYLFSRLTYEGTQESTLWQLRRLGVIPGLMPFRTGPYQRWIWEPVTTDQMHQAVTALMQAIERGKSHVDFPHFAESFDEDYYLTHSPDAVEALRKREVRSALEHYAYVGLAEGRRPAEHMPPPSPAIAEMTVRSLRRAADPSATIPLPQQSSNNQFEFDESYYLQLYPDVAKAVAVGQFDSGRHHYLSHGRREGRFPTPVPLPGGRTRANVNDVLVVYYDLTFLPESFDFCNFLLAAEAYRSRIGAGSIQMIIMVAPDEGWKYRSMLPAVWEKHIKSTGWWRIQHIVVALANMLITVRDIRLMTDRAECDRLWQTARYRYPVEMVAHDAPIYQAYREALVELYRGSLTNLLEAPVAAAQYVEQILKTQGLASKRLIVMTLREALFCPERNSNMPAWITLAEELRAQGYGVIIIPDTDIALTGKSMLDTCSLPVNILAAFDLYIRLAFYQRAYLNLFANGGPAIMVMAGARTRYLVFFKVQQPRADTDTAFLEHLGFRFGQQTPYPFQRTLDQSDTLDNVKREVWGLLHEMEAADLSPKTERDSIDIQAMAHFELGVQHHGRGELSQAEACFREALALAPNAVDILVNLGRVYHDQRRDAETQQDGQGINNQLSRASGIADSAVRLAHPRMQVDSSTSEEQHA